MESRKKLLLLFQSTFKQMYKNVFFHFQKSNLPKQSTPGDMCTICQKRVYLLERHIEEGKLFHRSCYRHSDLSPTNRVFTRSPFMSPSLSSEKVAPESHTTQRSDRNVPLTNISPRQTENKTKVNDTPVSRDAARSNLSWLLQRAEGDTVAKQTNDAYGKDTSEMKPKSLLENKNMHNRNDISKASEAMTGSDSISSMLPLSSKESRQLEKIRPNINSDNKPKVTSGVKRTMPLIFQQDSSESSKPKTSTTGSTPSTNTSNLLLSSSNKTIDDMANKKSIISSSSGLLSKSSSDNKTQSDVNSVKMSKLDTSKFPETALRKQSSPSILSSQQKKLGASDSNAKMPTAKPRMSATKETVTSNPLNHSDLKTKVLLSLYDSTPKVTPRKSIVEESAKRIPPERPKQPSNLKLSPKAGSSSYSADELTPRSASSSSSPPPLPTSPPPNIQPTSSNLPPSKPPPLPSSQPPNLPSNKDNKSSNFTHSSSEVPSSKTRLSHPTPPPQASKSPHDKSPHNKNTNNLSQSSVISSNNVQDTSVTVLVTPTTMKNETGVRNDLLASLAGIRGRSASTPSVEMTAVSLKTTSPTASHLSSPSSSLTSSIDTSLRKQSAPNIVSSLKPISAVSSNPRMNRSSSSVTNVGAFHLKPTSTSTTISLSKTDVQPEKDPEAIQVLSSLKSVSTSSTEAKNDKNISSSYENRVPVKKFIDNVSMDISIATQNESKIERDSPHKLTHTSIDTSSKTENVNFFKDVQLKSVTKDLKPLKQGQLSVAQSAVPGQKPEVSSLSQLKAYEADKEKDNQKQLLVSKEENKARDSSIIVPQWKKDIEERKRKMREDIAKSEASSDKPYSYTKHLKERPKSGDALSLICHTKESENDVPCASDDSPRSDHSSSSSSKSSFTPSEPHSTNLEKIKSDHALPSKLDWQLEAEKKMAAFASFDSSEDESKSTKVNAVKNKEADDRVKSKELKSNLSNSKHNTKEWDGMRPKKGIGLRAVDIDISEGGVGDRGERFKSNDKKSKEQIEKDLQPKSTVVKKVDKNKEKSTINKNPLLSLKNLVNSDRDNSKSKAPLKFEHETQKKMEERNEDNDDNTHIQLTKKVLSSQEVKSFDDSSGIKETVEELSLSSVTSSDSESLTEHKDTTSDGTISTSAKKGESIEEEDQKSSPKIKTKITFLGRKDIVSVLISLLWKFT